MTMCGRVQALFVLTLLLGPPAGAYEAGVPTRGRVQKTEKTIVTDWGTPLRMAMWGLDRMKTAFNRESLAAMKQCGLNAVHVYTELTTTSAPDPIGYNAEAMDSIVSWCRQESLYVVMTHGGPIAQSTVDKIRQIWEFYAPRYADETHVVYELKNEPGWSEVEIGKVVYPVVRELAPETHVLQGSYSNFKSGAGRILDPIEEIGDAIDWSNVSVAFHGYGTTTGFQEQVLNTVIDAGYPVTCTEFPTGGGLEQFYNTFGISYCHFLSVDGGLCGRVKSFGLSYVPDFGSWPQPHVDYPVHVMWQSSKTGIGGNAATMCLPAIDGLPQGNIRAIYDLSGRLLWDGPAGRATLRKGGLPGDVRALGFGALLVKYWEQ